MGDLSNRADSLEREIVQIARELNEKKDEVAALASKIRYIAEKAEKFEEENDRLKRLLEVQEKEYEKKLADAQKQQK